METLPIYISVIFGLTAVLTVYLFYLATNSSKIFLAVTIGWLIIQSVLGMSGYFHFSRNVPPKLPLLVGPPTFLILILFVVKPGRRFIDSLKIAELTLV